MPGDVQELATVAADAVEGHLGSAADTSHSLSLVGLTSDGANAGKWPTQIAPDVKYDNPFIVQTGAHVGAGNSFGAGTELGGGSITGMNVEAGKGVSVGWNAIVGSGAKLGDHAMVEDGAIVPAFTIVPEHGYVPGDGTLWGIRSAPDPPLWETPAFHQSK